MNASPPRSIWIHSRGLDLSCFIATPILCFALIYPLRQFFSSMDIFIVVMAFSSFGHHLPGFLRAYGDAELFRRFRVRFILAPLLIFATFLFFGARNLHGMALILMLWSIWHVMMQHYGFMRIYDAKVGHTDKSVARWDFWLSLGGFLSIVFWSPQYVHNILVNLYQSGAPFVPLVVFEVIRGVVWGATALTALGYVVSAVRAHRRGERANPLKFVLLIVTLSFLATVWVFLGDLVLGLAIWEIFHDIQYFAITWIYNRRLVEKGMGTTAFMRYLFRKRGALVALYMVAILAYGGVNYAVVTFTAGTWQTVLMAFVFTSTLLHYYYDGFIWKVRQTQTQAGLDLENADVQTHALQTSRLRLSWRGLVHVGLFLLPIGSLAAMELLSTRDDEVELRSRILEAAPGAAESHLNLARAYDQSGQSREALDAYRRAYAAHQDDAAVRQGLAISLMEVEGDDVVPEALEHLEESKRLDPHDPLPFFNAAVAKLHQGRLEEAVADFQRSLGLGFEGGGVDRFLLEGFAALQREDVHGALQAFDVVVKNRSTDALGWRGLLLTLDRVRGLDEALAAAHQGLRAIPEDAELRTQAVLLAIRSGDYSLALQWLEEHVTKHPEDLDRKLWLAEIYATHHHPAHRNGERGALLAEDVVVATERGNVGALDILAAAQAECGDFDSARVTAQEAIELAKKQGLLGVIEAIEQRRAEYAKGRAYFAPK